MRSEATARTVPLQAHRKRAAGRMCKTRGRHQAKQSDKRRKSEHNGIDQLKVYFDTHCKAGVGTRRGEFNKARGDSSQKSKRQKRNSEHNGIDGVDTRQGRATKEGRASTME